MGYSIPLGVAPPVGFAVGKNTENNF